MNKFKDDLRVWTMGQLKCEAMVLDEQINGDSDDCCFNSWDVLRLELVLRELDRRGVNSGRKLAFAS